MRHALLESSVLVLDEAVPGTLCHQLIAAFERDPNKQPGTTERGIADAKRSVDLDPRPDAVWGTLLPAFDQRVDECLAHAFSLDGFAFSAVAPHLRLTASRPQFQKYSANGHDCYDWHIDSLPPDRRVVAGIAYLNTVDEGGATEFLSGLAIRPVVGRVALFPPFWTHRHCGRTPVSGPKYIATWFIDGVQRDP